MLETKRPPKPQKPPITPLKPGQYVSPGISARQEMLIGRLVVEWAKLEAMMQDAIWDILNVRFEDGRVLTARMDARTKLQWLRTFSNRHVSQDELTKFSEIIELIELKQDDRNFIVHGTWSTMRPENVPVVSSLRQKSPPDEVLTESFPEWRMSEIIVDIKKCRDALVSWIARREASLGKPPRPPLSG
jgi:hypothetical protein